MVNLKGIYFVLLIAVATLCACGDRPTFNQWELRWVDAFNEGDTLVFKASDGQLDTSYIVKKEIFERNLYGERSLHAAVWYSNSALKYEQSRARLFTIIKHGDISTSFSISYLYATYLIEAFDQKQVEQNHSKGPLLMFDTDRSDLRTSQPKALFWDIEKGLVKYVTEGNVVWERIK